jgi:hypothetical protein
METYIRKICGVAERFLDSTFTQPRLNKREMNDVWSEEIRRYDICCYLANLCHVLM